MNVVKKYWENVYPYLILYTPIACICAGIYYTISWVHGVYPDLSPGWVILFDSTHYIYLLISLSFIYRKKKAWGTNPVHADTDQIPCDDLPCHPIQPYCPSVSKPLCMGMCIYFSSSGVLFLRFYHDGSQLHHLYCLPDNRTSDA